MTEAPFLEAVNISHAYGAQTVLHEMAFELERGEVLALYGPNGSGKSTLLKILGGVIDPSSRAGVRIGGRDLFALDSRTRARTIAYVGTELSSEFPLTVEQAVSQGRSPHRNGYSFGLPWRDEDRAIIRNAMELCHCLPLASRFIQTLSSGERQRVAIARALVQQPKVLLLDESLGRMDLQYQGMMVSVLRRLVRSDGLSVILVTHDPNLWTDWADRAVLIRAGQRIAWGSIDQTVTEKNLSTLYPGAPLRVTRAGTTGRPKVIIET